MKRVILAALLLSTILAARARGNQLGGSARVLVPPVVMFQVPNVTVETVSSGPVNVSFDSAILLPGQALRISVRADGDLTLPGGPAIPAANISWTTSNVAGGVGLNGTLSKTIYTPVYEGTVGTTSGHLDLTMKLAPPGGGIRAGTREAALRWRFEAITP
jgi:hypothetical protein